jgi:hypothetical protein
MGNEFTQEQIIEFKKTFASMAAVAPDDVLNQITRIVPAGTSAYFIVDAIQTWPHDPFVIQLIEKHQENLPKKPWLIARLVGITKDPYVDIKYKLVAYKLIAEICGFMPTNGPSGGSNLAMKKDDQLKELAEAVIGQAMDRR